MVIIPMGKAYGFKNVTKLLRILFFANGDKFCDPKSKWPTYLVPSTGDPQIVRTLLPQGIVLLQKLY